MIAVVSKNIWNLDKNVPISNDHSCSKNYSPTFEMLSSKSSDFKCFLISDPHWIINKNKPNTSHSATALWGLTVHGHLVNLCWVVLFNVAKDSDVVVLDKVDGDTLAAETARTADTVDVQLAVVGQIVVDDLQRQVQLNHFTIVNVKVYQEYAPVGSSTFACVKSYWICPIVKY